MAETQEEWEFQSEEERADRPRPFSLAPGAVNWATEYVIPPRSTLTEEVLEKMRTALWQRREMLLYSLITKRVEQAKLELDTLGSSVNWFPTRPGLHFGVSSGWLTSDWGLPTPREPATCTSTTTTKENATMDIKTIYTTKTVTERAISLVLSEKAADVLRRVLRRIGGDPKCSERKITREIEENLQRILPDTMTHRKSYGDFEGTLFSQRAIDADD